MRDVVVVTITNTVMDVCSTNTYVYVFVITNVKPEQL